jgi:hypothetical protein
MCTVRWSIALALIAAPAVVAEPDPKAQKAHAVLKAHCHRCHGGEGNVEGGMNYVLDLERLVARKKVVPGNLDRSPLYKRVAAGTMPPPEVKDRLSDADQTALRDWIAAGAPALVAGRKREFVPQSRIDEWVLADLEKIDRRARRFQRYFTFTHLRNAGAADDEVRTYRIALAKLVNSLSWHPKVRNPEPVDPDGTVFRIDLRWYMWDAAVWNRVLQEYPYGVIDDGLTGRLLTVFTATRVPVVRGDWFVANASRPPLYPDILQLPGNLAELERQLRVDAAANIAQERVMRVGFNGSGISKNNRVLERHDSVHGYYWRSYDFEEVPQNLADRGLSAPDRRNVFAYPLGPGSVENTFLHAGGEAIFSLPNGLQGYFIMDANNVRVNKGPTAIVADPKRPDKAVELGISCIGCHVPGIHPKADQVREHLGKNPRAVPKADVELALGLYPPKETSLAQMAEDSRKFQAALSLTGTAANRAEPVLAMTLRYEGDIDGPAAAAEAGLPWDEFRARLADSESLGRPLGSLLVPGGTVARQVWVQAFGDVVRELRLGSLFQASQIGVSLPDNTGELDPLEASAGPANQMAFSADGRRAIIASADRSVRMHEVEGRRDLKRFVGHTASVWAVALSADGKQALSGGMDGTVRVWDTATGDQRQKLEGHTGLVTAVAFAAGNRAVSGGVDGFVTLWDLTTGREVRRWRGPMKYVSAVAVTPDGSRAVIAADRVLRVWGLDSGKAEKVFEGHTAPVTAVAVSADGMRLISGGDDRTVRLWDLDSGKQIQTLRGHDGAVRSVAFSPDGNWALSAGADRTVRLWDLSEGKAVGVFRKHASPVVRAAFAGNGRQTVSGDRDGVVLIWDVQKLMGLPARK